MVFPGVLAARGGAVGGGVVEAEQDPEKAHPLTYAKMGYGYLRGVVEEAGFVVG